jgi:hypothetical protein
MAFPTSPSNGQTAVINGTNFVYNSTFNSWKVVASLVNANTLTALANTYNQSNLAIATANSSATFVNVAFTQANSSFSQANAAYAQANTNIVNFTQAFMMMGS